MRSMESNALVELDKDTNAQESLGKLFQFSAAQDALSVGQTYKHICRFITRFEYDFKVARSGLQLGYGSRSETKRKKEPYENDGRAPDTTRTLLPRSGAGRPKGSRNKRPKFGYDVDWSKFGIPWSIQDYNGFAATNTCPMDTTLMAWYLVQRFGGATLPRTVLETPAGSVLQDVMAEIAIENYDKARWLWCTKVLKMSETGQHSLFGTMDEVFLAYLPELSNFSLMESSYCLGADHCPNAVQVNVRKVASLPMSHPQISQTTLDQTLQNHSCHCTEPIQDSVVKEHGEDEFRKQFMTNIDSGEEEEWFTCRGTRCFNPTEFKTMPYLLVLNCLYEWNSSKDRVSKPAQLLRVGDAEYSLAVVMYGSGQHFCCTVMIDGRALFYDGAKKARKLRWLMPEEDQVPSGFQMGQVWYLNRSKANSFLLEEKVEDREEDLDVDDMDLELAWKDNKDETIKEEAEECMNTQA
ncbi:hypothetical protein BGZ99_002900, partial [Dissophora globulifera]